MTEHNSGGNDPPAPEDPYYKGFTKAEWAVHDAMMEELGIGRKDTLRKFYQRVLPLYPQSNLIPRDSSCGLRTTSRIPLTITSSFNADTKTF